METGIQYPESAIHGVESRILDCLGLPHWAIELNKSKRQHNSVFSLAVF